jgi:hypothetical protein
MFLDDWLISRGLHGSVSGAGRHSYAGEDGIEGLYGNNIAALWNKDRRFGPSGHRQVESVLEM